MKRLFEFFVKRDKIAHIFIFLMIILGGLTLLQIKRDTFPKIDTGEVIITTVYPGASPQDVELNVTNKLEDELKGISKVEEIVSYSMENVSIVTVTIDIDADDKDKIKTEIREAVNRVTDLPEEVREAPSIEEISSEEFPIIEVGISNNNDVNYRTLREAARLFKTDLKNLPGVSDVKEYWFLDREVKIEVSPAAIDRYQLPLQQVANAIRFRNIRSTGGSFETYENEKNLIIKSKFDAPNDVNDVVVRTTFNSPAVRVRDLANITDGFEEPRILARVNGTPAITFQVLKKGDADVIRTVESIRELAEEERKILPEGVEILFTGDMSYYVKNRFQVVLNNGAIGLVLVLILLTIFLNFRTAFWVALSIPVVLLGVIFLLPITGNYLDIISLTAMLIVLGIIVDDGIIVSENIVRMREKGKEPLDAAASGIQRVWKPVFATILSTLLAFVPLFFMPGVVGEVVVVIPLVITLALILSLIEVTIALPAHLFSGLKKITPGKGGNRSWFNPVRDAFKKIEKGALKLRYLWVILAIALFVGTIWYALNYMQMELFPGSAADAFYAYVELPVSASLEKTSEKVKEIEALIAEIPNTELESFATRVGNHGPLRPGESDNWAYINVNLTPFAKRKRTALEIVEELREKSKKLKGFKEITYDVDEGGPPVGKPLVFRIVGADNQKRRELTNKVEEYLSGINGVTGIERNDTQGKKQVQINLDYDRIADLGLSVADVARTIRIAYNGEIVTDVSFENEEVEFRLILEEDARANTAHLMNLLVPNRRGRLISLRDFASSETVSGPSNFYHYEGERATKITADIVEDTTTPVQVTQNVLNQFDLEKNWQGMRFEVGGEAQETKESFRSLYFAFGVAVVAIYFLLIVLFDSFTQPLTVVTAIPFGIISVIAAFALHGKTPGFMAMMGLVGLSGVVVNDSLVMVSHINRLRREKYDSVKEAVSQGASDRLRPVIMTTLTTVVGLVPLAYGIGGSDPFVAPLALALGYGLLFATPLTLFIVPCLYMIREDIFSLFGKSGLP